MRRIIAAAIMKDKKILIAKRNYGSLAGFWEFPGGKIEKNEDDVECICREIKEEFSATITVGSYLGEEKFQVDHKPYIMVLYQVEMLDKNLELKVHSEVAWVLKSELCNYQLAPVDEKLARKCFGGD
ncbi:MAG: (deoxy)nucleoside triphosphate pyrophosphohydrolase [Lachnospiraceae bacterium]